MTFRELQVDGGQSVRRHVGSARLGAGYGRGKMPENLRAMTAVPPDENRDAQLSLGYQAHE